MVDGAGGRRGIGGGDGSGIGVVGGDTFYFRRVRGIAAGKVGLILEVAVSRDVSERERGGSDGVGCFPIVVVGAGAVGADKAFAGTGVVVTTADLVFQVKSAAFVMVGDLGRGEGAAEKGNFIHKTVIGISAGIVADVKGLSGGGHSGGNSAINRTGNGGAVFVDSNAATSGESAIIDESQMLPDVSS